MFIQVFIQYQFLPQPIWNEITNETNRYADKILRSGLDAGDHLPSNWIMAHNPMSKQISLLVY